MLVIIEENYSASVWCRKIVDGLRSEARKKRVSLTFATDIDEMEKSDGDGAVFIVGAETEWLNLTAKRVKVSGRHPIILSNQSDDSPQNGVSRVTEDIYGSMNEIMTLFAMKGHRRTALYAFNPDSASDSYKKEAFLRSGGKADTVFENNGSLEECFARFYERHREECFGGIVCANDFAAISLIRHLNKQGESIEGIDMISYSNTYISRCTSPAISTVSASFGNFGQHAFMIADCISKGENVSGIRILSNWEIIHRETSSSVPFTSPGEENIPPSIQGSFYRDGELIEMMRVEDLLSRSDETDTEIIRAILKGKKTAEIVDSCYLTETAVKYRIKKMKDICHAESRSALKEILSRQIPRY